MLPPGVIPGINGGQGGITGGAAGDAESRTGYVSVGGLSFGSRSPLSGGGNTGIVALALAVVVYLLVKRKS